MLMAISLHNVALRQLITLVPITLITFFFLMVRVVNFLRASHIWHMRPHFSSLGTELHKMDGVIFSLYNQ